MHLFWHVIAFCSLISGLNTRKDHGSCRFSYEFSQDAISKSSVEFENNIFYWEGQFHTDGIGYRMSNGMTIGKRGLGYATGLPSAQVPEFTQSSPEDEVDVHQLPIEINMLRVI